jgi:hypothetical protein
MKELYKKINEIKTCSFEKIGKPTKRETAQINKIRDEKG